MKKQPFLLFFLLMILALLMVSCGESYLNNTDPNISGVQARATLEYVHAVQTSTTQAQNGAQWRMTLQAAATQDALNSSYLAAQSTSEVIRAEAGATQTVQVWNATTTAASNQATVTASANTAARSWSSTATQAVWNRQATADTAGLQAMQTAQAAQAEMAQLAVERQGTINTVQAAAPWVVFSVVVPLVAYLAWLWGKTEALRRRAIPRDARGDAPILILDHHGHQNVIDPDLFLGSVVTMTQTGQVEAPLLAPPDLQSQLKARDQAVDLLNRGLPGQAPRRRSLPALGTTQPLLPKANIRVVEPGEVKNWLPDVLPQIHRHALMEGEELDGNE